MKKMIFALVLVVIMVVLGGCSGTRFDGTRTGNDSQLIIEYKVLNRTDSQLLDLQEGDILDFVVASSSGKVDILVQKDGNNPIYEGTDVPTSSFAVEVEEAGSYTVSVTGDHARGGVSITKRV